MNTWQVGKRGDMEGINTKHLEKKENYKLHEEEEDLRRVIFTCSRPYRKHVAIFDSSCLNPICLFVDIYPY